MNRARVSVPRRRPASSRRARRLAPGLVLVALLGALVPLAAQVIDYSTFPFDETPMKPDDPRSRVPRLSFTLRAEVPLPGPLPGDPPRLAADGRVELPVAGAVAVATVEGDATTVQLRPAQEAAPADPAGDSGWVLDPSGTRRFRTEPAGLVIAERCCTWFRKRWRRDWKLRIAAGTPAPPLVVRGRVFVGALDNQVYALRARNGHRMWSTDVGQRVTHPLALWSGTLRQFAPRARRARSTDVQLVIAVLDGGVSSTLLALDAISGTEVARFQLDEADGRLVGAALATAGGEVVVPRQSYAQSEAALLVFGLTRPEPSDDEQPPRLPRPDAG